jgi:hypothetical protein
MIGTVHKAQLVIGEQWIVVPQGAKFLHVHQQQNNPYIWYLCNPSNQMESRRVIVVLTGAGLARLDNYVGTIHMDYGQDPFVLHVFED